MKALLTRSYRRKSDFFSRGDFIKFGKESSSEKLDSLEISYARHLTESLLTKLTGVYSQWDVLAFSAEEPFNEFIGEMKLLNFEFELSYHGDKFDLGFSHTYTDMRSFELENPSITQLISASPDGFGDDLNSWSNHMTKFYMTYDWHERLTGSLSTVIYWGYPGAEDMAELTTATIPAGLVKERTQSDGRDRAFGESVFVNGGLHYDYSDRLQIDFMALNILGWLDKDYNKRNFNISVGTYRNEAPAFSLSLTYKF